VKISFHLRVFTFLCLSLLVLITAFSRFQPRQPLAAAAGTAALRPLDQQVEGPFRESTAAIMARQAPTQAGRLPTSPALPETVLPLGRAPREAGASQALTSAGRLPAPAIPAAPSAAQTLGVTFTSHEAEQAFSITLSAYTPPDTMGVVGPTEFVTVLNGVIRANSKSDGAVGYLDTGLNNFFSSVRSSKGTGDPRVWYDRLSDRWVISCFNRAESDNRILLAVSDPTITDIDADTMWTFFYFVPSDVNASDAGLFADYPTLGVDANAVYISAGMFSGNSFANTSAFVINKSQLYASSGGNLATMPAGTITGFPNLANCVGCSGMFAAHGASSYNPSGSDPGYFISIALRTDDVLIIRRVNDPGSSAPTLGPEILVPVPQGLGYANLSVDTADATTDLDALEWRLMAAHLRDGRLWTTNTQFVNASGAPSPLPGARAAVRFYEIDVSTATPALLQTGTIYDSAATNPFNYWMGTVMVSGQGHAALGFSRTSNASGAANWPAAATAGRLAGDPSGTVQGTPLVYQAGQAAYKGYSFETLGRARRWGDYSMTSLDPCDDMTIWTIQEYSGAIDGFYGTLFGTDWAVAVAGLKAPAPTITQITPSRLEINRDHVNVTLTGTGFYSPPQTGMSSCRQDIAAATAFPGLTVHSLTYIDANTLQLDLSTGSSAGQANLVITNPDGQTAQTTLTVSACSATPDDGATVFPSVQQAVDAASPGDTVKIAGTCQGVVANGGSDQIAYLDKDLTVQGGYTPANWSVADPAANPTFLDAHGSGRVIRAVTGVTATLRDLNLTGGQGEPGGGIYNAGHLTISDSLIDGNQASGTGSGGGIYNTGALEVDRSTISDNSALSAGGGIFNQDGSVTVHSSTIAGNQAQQAGGIGNLAISAQAVLTLTNSTVYSNTAATVGALANTAAGAPAALAIRNSTITGNTETANSAAVANFATSGTATLTLQDTVLAANATRNLGNYDGGILTSLGHNLSDDDGSGFLNAAGDQINTDPQLGPLQDNGGPTSTHILLSGSPAIDTGICSGGSVTSDQRGVARPQGAACDIGAVENREPSVSIEASPEPADEGSPVQFTGDVVDSAALAAQAGDILWDFGDGITATGILTPTHTFQDNGVFTVTLTAAGTTGVPGSAQTPITVNNVAPIVMAGPDQGAKTGQVVAFSGSFSDPGALDTHTYQWHFGDGTTASGSLAPTHIFTAAGAFTVTLTVTDKDGGIGVDTLNVSVEAAGQKVYLPLLLLSNPAAQH
jgi:hypothetical protein